MKRKRPSRQISFIWNPTLRLLKLDTVKTKNMLIEEQHNHGNFYGNEGVSKNATNWDSTRKC